MLSLIKNHVSDAAAPFIFVLLFLLIVGASLWLTPRVAKWLDGRSAGSKGYFDGMLEEDPGRIPEKKDGDGGKKAD